MRPAALQPLAVLLRHEIVVSARAERVHLSVQREQDGRELGRGVGVCERTSHGAAVSRRGMPDVLERVRAGEEDPPCLDCGGILKSATISFGQALVPEVIDRANAAASAADLFMAIGTSLQVYPVAGLVPLARSAGARLIIVNAEPTPFDDLAAAVFATPIGDVLPQICAAAD